MTSTEHVNHNHHQHHYEESVRDIEQIHHVNETISQDDSYRAQTEASNIQIVTPHYKSGERPGSEVRTGASAAELNAKFAATNGDYKAERSQEHFRMQIIDPKVNSNAHLPAHAPREYARKKLIDDFPSLHSKRSFLDLDALEQRTTRKPKPISISKYLTDSVDRHPKKDDFRDLDKLKKSLDALQKRYSKPMEHQIEELDLSKIPLAPRSPFLVRAYAPDSNHNNLEDYSKQKDYSNAASISAESTLKNGTVNFDISTVNKTKIPAKNAPMLDNISDDNYYRNSIEKFRQNQEENRIPTQEHNQDQNPNKNYDNDSSEGRVIIWPPLNEKRVDIVVNKPRSIFDESRRAEFERQKAREIAAMRRRDAAASKYRAKQHEAQRFQRIRALEKARELEKDQILDLKINASSSRHDYENETESNSTYDNENENTVKTIHGDPNYRLHIFEAPSNLRIVNGEDYDNATRRFWERTFPPLDGSPKSRVSTRNEILTSEELIRREFTFDIDLLERRNAFIESSSEPPKIHYLGRRWHPPPEDPANVPHTPNDSLTNEYQQNGTMDFAFNIDEYCDSHYSNGLDGNNTISHRKNNNTTLNTRQKHSNDNTISEYKWIPTVNNSEYAGHDSGELDAAARRQLRDVVVPSSDGSHRPNTVFARVRRRIPAGGFSPHAPNVVKRYTKKKAKNLKDQFAEIQLNESIEEKTPLNNLASNISMNYDNQDKEVLPKHSSTITSNQLGYHNRSKMVRRRVRQFDAPPPIPSHRNRRSTNAQCVLQYFERMVHAGESVPRSCDMARPYRPVPLPPDFSSIKKSSTLNEEFLNPYKPMSRQRTLSPARPFSRQNNSRIITKSAQKPKSSSFLNENRSFSALNVDCSNSGPGLNTSRTWRGMNNKIGSNECRGQNSSNSNVIEHKIKILDVPKRKDNSAINSVSHEKEQEQYQPEDPSHNYSFLHDIDYKNRNQTSFTTSYENDRNHSLKYGKNKFGYKSSPKGLLCPAPDYEDSGSDTNIAASEPKRSATNQHNSELDELARRSREIAERSRYARSEYHIEPLEIKNSPKIPYSMAYSPRSTVSFNETPKCATVMTSASSMPTVHNQENESGLLKSVLENGNSIWASTLADNNGGYGSKSRQRYSYASTMKSLLREEPPPAPPVVRTVVRHEPVRQEIVEVRREVKPRVTQNVQRFEERKRTEEVERRVIRRERRHKSSRIRYGHHAGGHHEFHQDWSSGGARKGVRSNSAASRNGYGGGGHGDYYYHHGSSRYGGGADSAASDFFHRGSEARYGGSVSDSLRRGDLKYGPNGDVRQNGHNGNASEKYSSTRRVHKSYSTRDVHGGGSSGYGSHQPVVEFPPTLPRHSASSRYGAPAPPPHRQNGFQSDYYYGGSGGGGGYGSAGDGRLTKSRSYADWGDGGRGPFGNSSRRYNDDMARLENEFRDSLLMKLPTNGGTMNERDYRHEQIPGGYETYEREVKASSGRKNYPDGVPTDFKETSHGYNIKRETQR